MFYLKLINKLIQDCGGLIDQFVDVLDGSRSTAVGVSGAGACHENKTRREKQWKERRLLKR